MKTNEILKKLRMEKKLSTRELSRRLGMKEGAVSEIETGKKNLTIENLKKYCDYFKESADYILNIKHRIKNIIFENDEIILYDFIIKEPDDWNDIYCYFKIKFKKDNWPKLCVKFSFEYCYYWDEIEDYRYKEDIATITWNSNNNSFIKNNEEFEILLLDYKLVTYDFDYIKYPLKNVTFKILKIGKEINNEQ